MQNSKMEVRYAFCWGTGQARGGVCWVCGGEGTVSLPAPTRPCAYCGGTGLHHRDGGLTCGVCRGMGWVVVEEDADLCPSCNGTGMKPAVLSDSQFPCLVCRGKGVIAARRAKALRLLSARP